MSFGSRAKRTNEQSELLDTLEGSLWAVCAKTCFETIPLVCGFLATNYSNDDVLWLLLLGDGDSDSDAATSDAPSLAKKKLVVGLGRHISATARLTAIVIFISGKYDADDDDHVSLLWSCAYYFRVTWTNRDILNLPPFGQYSCWE